MIYTDKIHLVADSMEELHAFAHKVGIARAWYHASPSHPHYDVPKKKLQGVLEEALLVTGRDILRVSKTLAKK